MKTPIADFVKEYIKKDYARFHMPGHKGKPSLGCESGDITEIPGADELYAPKGIILESENNAARLFTSSRTVYCTGGSSQAINAMLFAAFLRADKRSKPYVLAGRNAHKSFIYALSKLGAEVSFIYPENEGGILSCNVPAKTLEKRLSACREKPFAVYITSPDYLGGTADIKALSAVCAEFNVPLLVDNAHGSYLKFCEEDLHPLTLGADMCCDSAHKTLPVLTGGAYIHAAADDKYGFAGILKRASEIFGSTSPSYLVLESLDLCNDYLENTAAADIKASRERADAVRAVMKSRGISDVSSEPLKISADLSRLGMTSSEMSAFFESRGVEPEYCDGEFAVFMFTGKNESGDFKRLASVFEALPRANAPVKRPPAVMPAQRALSVREAVFSPCEEIKTENALGRICAAPSVSCPPAIPIAVSGEIISENHIELFKYYNIDKICVVCEE